MCKYLAILMILLSISNISAQIESKSASVSLHTGAFLVSSSDFSKVYDSRLGFIFGGALGLPISTRLGLYAKATLFQKNGIPIIATYKIENGQSILVSQTRNGSAEFKQWLFNFGLYYNIFLSREYTMTANGGINYTLITEKQISADGKVGYSQDNNKFLGFWIGSGIEKNFNDSPFSIFGEIQYNYIKQDVFFYNANYGGININVGGRFYFKERRLE